MDFYCYLWNHPTRLQFAIYLIQPIIVIHSIGCSRPKLYARTSKLLVRMNPSMPMQFHEFGSIEISQLFPNRCLPSTSPCDYSIPIEFSIFSPPYAGVFVHEHFQP